MLLTLTTTYSPAGDLGYLLAKHPGRAQTFPLNFGSAHVFYPEASDQRCTAALLLDIDPVGLVRREGEFALEQYVNDRPYVASSFLSVAIAQVYGSALGGRCKERPELAMTPIPLEATITALPCRDGEDLLRGLFEPLGYSVTVERIPLDPAFPAWGMSAYYTLTLQATTRLQDLLSHLYVLIPVLDEEKHYYVGDAEVEKLLRHGEGWLKTHPLNRSITRRYLLHKQHLTRSALEQLLAEEEAPADEAAVSEEATPSEEVVASPDGEGSPVPEPDTDTTADATAEAQAKKIGLHQQRLAAALAAIKAGGARKVLDLGCGEGQLIRLLLKEPQFTRILGMDVSSRALTLAARKLRLEAMPPRQKERLTLIHGSLLYKDSRLLGYDAAAVVEVVEHLDPPRLAAFERVLFGSTRPPLIALTTPNAEYNVMWESLPGGQFRHADHRFEWTRAEFAAWATRVAETYGYQVTITLIGEEAPEVGAASQMALFSLQAS